MAAGICMIAIAAFLFTGSVWAQESESAGEEQPIQEEQPAEEPAEEPPQEEDASGDGDDEEVEAAVEADAAVDAEDFGVTEAKIIKPDNPLYGVKRLFRNIREAVTFDPIKKAELKLQHASQELVDANAVLEEHPDDPEAIQIAVDAIEEYTEQVGEIQEDISEVVMDEEFETEGTDEDEEGDVTGGFAECGIESGADAVYVCGIDEITYFNRCHAEQHGVEVLYEGACVIEGRPNNFCSNVADPVCGSDGISYTHECFASQNGAEVQYAGSCTQDIEFFEVDDALAGDGEGTADFMAVTLDRNIQFSKLFEQMKERMLSQSEESGAPQAVLAMEDFASGAQARVGAMVASFAQARGARFTAGIMDGVMDAQEGSQFKDLRNNEMLQRLEDQVPEEARDAIRRAQENGMKRFAHNFDGIHPDKRAERFFGYMDGVDGDETRHMQMLDVMKNLDGMPSEVRAQVEAAKDVMVNRLSDRYTFYDEKFQDAGVKQDFRSRIFGRYTEEFKEGPPDAEQLRVIQEIDDRILAKNVEMKADIEKHRDAGVEAFKAAFTDEESVTQATRYRELSKKLLENPDPTTFRLIQQMHESVLQDPKKREFIEAMERDARANFITRAQAEGDVFYDKISTNNPRDLKFVQDLQDEWQNDPDEFIPSPLMGFSPEGGLPQGFGIFGPPGGPPGQGFGPPPEAIEKIFEKFKKRQSEVVAGNVDFISDPALFAQFQGKFEGASPDIINEIQKHQANFSEMFHGKRDFILQKAIVQEEYEAQAEGAGAGGFQGKFSDDILGGPAFLCDESCQKAQMEKFGDFRKNIQGQFGGFDGAPPDGFEIKGIPPEVLEQIKAKFEGRGVPFHGQAPGRQPQKPAEPKQLLDESGAPVRDDQREEFFRRQEEAKRAKEREKDFVPDTIFYRDDDARNEQFQKPPVETQPIHPAQGEFRPPAEFQKPSEEQFKQFIQDGSQVQPPPQFFEGFKPPEGSFQLPTADFPKPEEFQRPPEGSFPQFEQPSGESFQFPSEEFFTQPPQQ